MVNKIQSEIVNLSQIAATLKNKPEEITDKQFVKIVDLVEYKLKELSTLCHREGFTSLTEQLKMNIQETLKELNQGFDHCLHENPKIRFQDSKVQDLKNRILNVERDIDSATVHRQSAASKIGLKIGFFCDVDVVDHNTAITRRMELAIKQEFPFVTTRSMLRCTGVEDTELGREKAESLEKRLIDSQSKWDIYQLQDSDHGNEFMVFLPKSLLPDKEDNEKLAALDFVVDGTLKKISIAEALKGPQGKPKIDSLFKLFTPNPKIEKLFYLSGHGGAASVGGLNEEHYQDFLSFLEQQNCRGLTITSCSAGGESSLLNVPEKPEANEISNYEQQPKEHSFTTIVRSIGDFPTKAGQPAEEEMALFFDELALFLENSEPTLAQLRPIVDKLEKGKEKRRSNFIKVYFPHSADIPGGFRPLGEQGLGFSLTLNKVRQNQLLSQKPFAQRTDETPSITVRGKEFLEVHPLVTNAQILFKNKDSILLSMIPGSAHHFIQSIESNQEPEVFISETINFHKKSQLNSSKGFFIGSLNSKNNSFKQVALMILPEKAYYTYEKNGKYFFNDGSLHLITPVQHAIICRMMEKNTTPSKEAIRASTGGQENERLFREAIRGSLFLQTPRLSEWIYNLEELLKGKSLQEALVLIENEKFAEEEKQDLLFLLINLGFDKLALEFLKNDKSLNINAKNYRGVPLICHVIKWRKPEWIQYLIDQGVNLNVVDPTNYQASPLHLAVASDNNRLVEFLIKDLNYDVDIKDELGRTPLFSALPENREGFELLLQHHANIDEPMKDEETLVSAFSKYGMYDTVNFLLLNQADPNKGIPSPLITAIRANDPKLVKMLLRKGANPFVKDQSGQVPFIQAAFTASEEIFFLFLEMKNCDLNVQDADGIFPLAAALFSGNEKKIQALQMKQATFPDILSQASEELLKTVFYRLGAFQDIDTLKQILNMGHSSDLEYLVCQHFVGKHPEFIRELIIQGFIHPDTKNSDDASVFNLICSKATDFDDYENLISACLAKGVDVNNKNIYGDTPIDYAVRTHHKKFVKILLKAGADLSKTENPWDLFNKIIILDDLDLVKLALTKNLAKMKRSQDQNSPLLTAALNIQNGGKEEIFKWLLAKGGNLNDFEPDDMTAFGAIIFLANLSLIEHCLLRGAEIDLKDKDVYSPMEFAALLRNSPDGQVIKKLVEWGGDLNASCKNESVTIFSLLISSVKPEHLELIDWALEKEALLDPPNPDQKWTPLQAAAARNDDPQFLIFKKLVEAGANINAPGNDCAPSPLEIIKMKGGAGIIQWCREHGAKRI